MYWASDRRLIDEVNAPPTRIANNAARYCLFFPLQLFTNTGKLMLRYLQYLSGKTGIPLPRLQGAFDDDGAFYQLTDSVPDIAMSDLKESNIFCHNNFGQYNVIADPDTWKSKAIIDWECGGFWP